MKSARAVWFSIIVLLVWIPGCKQPSGPLPSGPLEEEAKLVLEWQILSVEVGKTETISILAVTEDGSTDVCSVTCSGDCIDVDVTGSEISVTGVTLGEATIMVESGSGLSETIAVRVFDPMALMTDGLLIRYTDQFTSIWHDAGSGADDNGRYWKPVAPAGYYSLGSLGGDAWADPNGNKAVIVVKELNDSGALAAPLDYALIWTDSGSGANLDGSFWRPIPPAGYVACGVVAQLGYGKPGLDEVRCVRSDLVSNGKAGDWIWDDSGSGASADFGSWEVECPDAQNSSGKAYLKAGTFVGTNSYSPPASHPALYVLNVHLPVVADVPETNYTPSLDGADEPELYTEAFLSKMVAVPFPLIYDAAYSLHDKVTDFPIYRVRRDEFYELAYFYNNMQGSTPIIHTETTRTGISETDSTTYSHSVGISISADMGCSLIGGSVSVSVSYQFGYETSSSLTAFQEKEVNQQVEIPAGKAGCLWHKTTRFSLLRANNNWETVAGSEKDIKINSFVKGEYPH